MPANHLHDVRHDVPFVEVNSEGQIVSVSGGKSGIDPIKYIEAIQNGTIGVPSTITTHTPGTDGQPDYTITDNLGADEQYQLVAVELTAGVTYAFNETGLVDPYLILYNSDGVYVTEDDDGGMGRTSQITYTATETGTHYLLASSWYHLDPSAPGYPTADSGDFTIAVWQADSSNDVGSTLETAADLGLGTTYGHLEAPGDFDMYEVQLTEGLVYTFNYSGGVSGGADFDGEPGENLAYLDLFDANGNPITFDVNYETGLNYYVEESGTYYIQVSPYDAYGEEPPEMTGGYTLSVDAVDPATVDPLESLNWDSANNIPTVMVGEVETAYVYFAPAGENFGELADDGVTPMTTYGWTQKEMDAVMLALAQYTPITGIHYEITTDSSIATFRLLTTTSTEYGAYFYPQDPVDYGTQQGIGVFNVNSGGWDKPGVSSQNIPGDQVSLDQGGFAFGVILHEFGHAHGIAHPHDTGGGSEVMLGVTASQGSYGVYDLNQGVYTVMSYNDAWDFHPDGPSSFSIAGIDNGWSGTLGAFDIAILQERYGVHAYNDGDTTYTLTDSVNDAYYQTIWDSSGDNDTIAYGGALNAQIDLTAATLDYSPTGGGVVSFLHNDPATAPASAEIKGGFTIANGVVIENATGGSGNDALLGNSAGNVLTGNDGNDTLMGRGGDDSLVGGNGSDTASYANAEGGVTIDLEAGTASGADGNDSLDSIENAIGSDYADTIIGNAVANVLSAGAGDDFVYGGDGFDVISLGAGNDVFFAEVGATKIALKGPNKGPMSVDIITDFKAEGSDQIDVSDLGAFTFDGTNANKDAGDLTYKTYDNVNAAEKALGIDIDGRDGAGGVSGPVTVVYGNTDGGAADFAVVLLNTNGVSASDFIFG